MSEYLTEEEQVARLRSWWNENGTSTVVTVIVALAAVGGWRWYDDYAESRTHAASDAYAEYRANPGDETAARVATEFEGTSYHVLVLLDQAKRAVEEGDLERAEAQLEQALDVEDGPLLGDLARIRLASVQQGLDKSEAALATLRGIRSDGYRPLALELQGDIHSARGELASAYESYKAAAESLGEGPPRPLLEMKLANAAPYGDRFVQPKDALGEALDAAQETLEAAVEETVEDTIDNTKEALEAVDPAAGTPTGTNERSSPEPDAPSDG